MNEFCQRTQAYINVNKTSLVKLRIEIYEYPYLSVMHIYFLRFKVFSRDF